MHTSLPPHLEIHTDRLLLRLVTHADLPMLMAVNGNDAVTRFLPYPSWKNLGDADAWFNRIAARQASGDAAQFVLVLKASGQVIGSCLLFRFDLLSSRAELGYVLAQQYWGGGFMFEAMKAFIAAAFGSWGLRRLEAQVDPRNRASAHLLERLGFVQEGLLRQRWVTQGQVSDTCFYGLLHSDLADPALVPVLQ